MNDRGKQVNKIRRHYEAYLQGNRGVDIDEILYYLGVLIDAYDEQGKELDLCRDENANHVADVERLRKALDIAMSGDMDPEDRVVIRQVLEGAEDE